MFSVKRLLDGVGLDRVEAKNQVEAEYEMTKISADGK